MSLATAIKIARLQADAHGFQAAAHEAQAEAFALEGNHELEASYRQFAKSYWSHHENSLQRARELESES